MEIRNLECTDFDTLFSGFENAFSDYEIHFDKDEVRSMLIRRGYAAGLSYAAFENGRIVAFILNGTGSFRGVPTAYDCGTGTSPQYRGQGIARQLFRHSIPVLKEASISQYLLEVLQNNHKAISVYRKMGFEISRHLDCFRQDIRLIDNTQGMDRAIPCRIERIDTGCITQLQTFCDFYPSWQNSAGSIERSASGLECIGAFLDGKPAGCCVFDIHTGDLTQIAVKQSLRRRGIASRLLHEAILHMETESIKVLNVDSTDRTLPAFLQKKNIPLANSQFEMMLTL